MSADHVGYRVIRPLLGQSLFDRPELGVVPLIRPALRQPRAVLALMRIFAAQPGQALSRLELVEELGRENGETNERAIDVQITRLRRKIEADSKQPRYLQTVRGAGYMLVPD